MRIETREENGVVILDLQGKLMGGPDAETFKTTFHKLLEKGSKKVVVNLHGVDWINSTGMGILISGYTTMRRGGAISGCSTSRTEFGAFSTSRSST